MDTNIIPSLLSNYKQLGDTTTQKGLTVFYSTRKENRAVYKALSKSCTLKDVEIIELVNEGKYSLPEAYNKALLEAKYDIVVCVHDDVELEKGWDKKIYDYFEQSEYGILGVAGTTDLDATGIWWNIKTRMIGNVWHNHAGKWHPTPYSNTYKNRILPAVCIDGLFMAIHKKRIQIGFDESFKGFHFYDIPICVTNHLLGVKIGVVTDIQVMHKSIGVPNNQWNENRLQFTKEYGQYLPMNVVPPIQIDFTKRKLTETPKIGIIIPTKNNFDYLEKCIKGLLMSSYEKFTIYIADTGSEKEVFDKYLTEFGDLIKSGKIKLTGYDFYNFARINNAMVKTVVDKDTEVLLFCNDDTAMLNDAIWLLTEQYIKHQRSVGTIGARLYFGNDSVQHGGIDVFITKATKDSGEKIGLTHKGIQSYYRVSEEKEYDVFGNTGAFLMIGMERFLELGGFNEHTQECMEDVLLNVDCILRGYKNIYVGGAVCYHYESVTRKKNPKKREAEHRDLVELVIPKLQKNLNILRKYFTIFK